MSDAPTPDQRPVVLVNCPITDASRVALAPHFTLLDTAEGAQIRAIISDGPRIIDKAMMDALPGLELIIGQGVRLDAIDLDEARRRGIQAERQAPGQPPRRRRSRNTGKAWVWTAPRTKSC